MTNGVEMPFLVAEAAPLPVGATSDDAIPVGRWAWTLVLLLATTVYVDTLSYQFVWDDATMILQNPGLRDLRNLPQLLRNDFTSLTGGAMEGNYYRPVMALSLALDFLLWGPQPAPFHLTNILLHLAVTVLVGRLAMAMGAGRGLAVLAALLFSIHPVHVEAVAFVSARSDLLPVLGMLGSILAYRRAAHPGSRRGAWFLIVLACQVLALLSKEAAVTLPAVLLLSDLLAPPSSSPRHRTAWRRAVARSLPFWGVTAVFVAFRLATVVQLAGDRIQGGGLWYRLPGSLEILGRYVWLLLIPTRMQPFYSLPRPTSLLEPWPVLGLLVAVSLLSLLCWCWRRAPLAAFGVGWFLITVIPVLDLIPVSPREMGLADRYLYLPSVGMALSLAQAVHSLMGPAPQQTVSPRRLAGWTAVMLLLMLYPWHLLHYAPVWRDNLALFERMERAAPRSPNPAFNLGLTYYRAGDFPRAAAAMERAVRTNPSQRRPREVLGLLYVLQGRTADGFRLLDAVASEGPPDRDYYVARTTAHLFVGEWQQALAVAEAGAVRFPSDADIKEGHGRALERLGRPAEAMESYRQALTVRPDMFQVEDALGHLLARSGRRAEAAQHFLRSAEVRPDRPQPIRALALLSEVQGDRSESLRLWRQVLELAGSGPAIREAAGHIRRLEREGAGPEPRPEEGRGT